MTILILKIIMSIFLWYLLAFCIGGLFDVPENGEITIAGHLVYGMTAIFALMSTLAIPMKLLQCSLDVYCLGLFAVCVVLAVFAVVWKRKQYVDFFQAFRIQKNNDTCVIFCAVLLQIAFMIFFMKTDYETSSLLALMTENYENGILPDYSQLFVLVFTSWGRLIHVPPVILANTFSGLLFLPVCYLCFYLCGSRLFHNNRKKTIFFVGTVILFFAVGSSYDINFRMFEGQMIFGGILFPLAIYLLAGDLQHWKKRAVSGYLVLAAGLLTGGYSLAALGLLVLIFVLTKYGAGLVQKYADNVEQTRKKYFDKDRVDEKGEEDDFMNTKKGKLLFAGYMILIPILLALIFSIFKLNNKINSVYEITQEIKQTQGTEESVSTDTVSSDDAALPEKHDETITADGGDYTLSCFSEADGKSFITFDTPAEEDYKLYQHDVNEEAGGLSYIIELPSGGLVLIDGGYYADGVKLHDFIVSHGGKIEAWFLTHPHYDHIGAFLYCMTEGRADIEVKNVYYSPFTAEFLESSDSIDSELEYEAFDFADFEKIRQEETAASFIPMMAGDVAEVEDIHVECLSSFDSAVDDVNDNSLVLKMFMNDISMMITGDITAKTVDRMIERYGETPEVWDVNFLQVPHHGYTGAGEKLYDLTQPEFVLLDCSTTEYNNDILGIQSETAARLHDRGIGIVKRFEGTNVVLIK